MPWLVSEIEYGREGGGRHVPEEVVRRRFYVGWRNFQQTYREIVDHWALYDASGRVPKIIAEGGK